MTSRGTPIFFLYGQSMGLPLIAHTLPIDYPYIAHTRKRWGYLDLSTGSHKVPIYYPVITHTLPIQGKGGGISTCPQGPIKCPYITHTLPIHYPRSLYGTLWTCRGTPTFFLYGQCMGNNWVIYGHFMGPCGQVEVPPPFPCMGNVWVIYG